ncbi:hypothetical protein C2E23DRAFT_804974 [Lenzites betulinus]|nr:hypothetical protein C2E23DRAFT_804974 [Lenzites betulinus]
MPPPACCVLSFFACSLGRCKTLPSNVLLTTAVLQKCGGERYTEYVLCGWPVRFRVFHPVRTAADASNNPSKFKNEIKCAAVDLDHI